MNENKLWYEDFVKEVRLIDKKSELQEVIFNLPHAFGGEVTRITATFHPKSQLHYLAMVAEEALIALNNIKLSEQGKENPYETTVNSDRSSNPKDTNPQS